eukprot:TRINITY_DN17002_c0_g2_i1.p1 TRINITY_DN17002_c0_g2~~TRINITY_DN17002_c0_g2_i1.p1  ORF type:complete len:145 (+),score=13.51 TRINITY_DN17002_c0_g2_i1:39-473(+)
MLFSLTPSGVSVLCLYSYRCFSFRIHGGMFPCTLYSIVYRASLMSDALPRMLSPVEIQEALPSSSDRKQDRDTSARDLRDDMAKDLPLVPSQLTIARSRELAVEKPVAYMSTVLQLDLVGRPSAAAAAFWRETPLRREEMAPHW